MILRTLEATDCRIGSSEKMTRYGGEGRNFVVRLTRCPVLRAVDVRFAVRQLIAARGFTSVAVLTLALGIGVNSAISSLADPTLLRPLPFGQPERLVMLWERTPTSPKTGVSPLNMRDGNLQSR